MRKLVVGLGWDAHAVAGSGPLVLGDRVECFGREADVVGWAPRGGAVWPSIRFADGEERVVDPENLERVR